MTHVMETPNATDVFRAIRRGQWPATTNMSVAEIVAAVRKSAWSRTAFTGAMALLSLPVLAPLTALTWFVAIAAWEYAVRAFLERALALSAPTQSRGFAWLAAINLLGATLYAAFPALMWLNGDVFGVMLVTAWLCATVNHAFVYLSGSRLVLLACLVPPFALAVIAPLASDQSLTSIVGVAVLLLLMTVGALFGFDRQVLLANMSRQTQARIFAEEANAAKTKFLASISHELRTPLAAVIGYAELIEEDAQQQSIAADAVKIRQAARQLLGVIDVIIDVSKLESGALALRKERVDLAVVFEHLREAALPLCASNGNTLAVAPGLDLGVGYVDHVRLHQCALQLVSSAAKFTRDGHIEVRGRRETTEQGEQIVLEVVDTGAGVAVADRERIFSAFEREEFQTAHPDDGMGLGLTLVRRLARIMGGEVHREYRAAGAAFRLSVEIGGVAAA